MNGPAFSGCLAGASFAFRTDAPDLARYAGVHLAPLAAEHASAPAVSTVLRWHEGQPPKQRPVGPQVDRLDRDLYATTDTLSWFRVDDLRDLYLHFTWREGRLSVEGDFYFRLGHGQLRDRMRRLLAWRDLRHRRFTTLLYYLVYYPCWWWLEQTQDLHPIHAAGVLTDAGVTLLAGASGVGKSSLAVALGAAPGARLLSDSFVVQRAADVYAVPEPVLLDAWSRQWLGSEMDALQVIAWQYGLGRGGYHVPSARRADEGRAALLVFPRRSTETYLRPVTAERAHQRLSAVDLIINDLRRYWAFAAVLEQLVPGGLVARREAHLAKLVNAVPCYEMGLRPDVTSRVAVEFVMRLLQDTPVRIARARS